MLVKKMPVYLNFKLLDRQIMTPQVLIPRQVNVLLFDIQVRQSPQDLTPLGVSFFKLKIRINRPNLNQNRKYYNPLVRDTPTVGSNDEKNVGRKSRWTVPLKSIHKRHEHIPFS